MNAPFFIRFLVCSINLSPMIIVLLLIKKLLARHILDRFQYYLWHLFLLMLAVPFLPMQAFYSSRFLNWLPTPIVDNAMTMYFPKLKAASSNMTQSTDWMQDFSVSVHPSSLITLNTVLFSVWLIGMILMLALTCAACCKTAKLRQTAWPFESQAILQLFEECKKNLVIRKDIKLYFSPLTAAPITFGLLRPCILLPSDILSGLTEKDLKYILLHELQHYKRKDILVNYIMCFFRILYWFHPVVWYALKAMHTDREVACDMAVLNKLDTSRYFEYGNTIIHFADKYLRSSSLSAVSEIGGSKNQIKKRLTKIASFHPETKWTKFKSILIFALSGLIILMNTPAFSTSTSGSTTTKLSNNKAQTTYEDLSSYFEGYEGCFVLYDLKADKYSVFNKEQSQKRISPDSTYKIFSALFALEEGHITKDHSIQMWNKTPQPYETWNQDHDLFSAMKYSVTWYFQNLDKVSGAKMLQAYYNRIGYGNSDLSGGLSGYWMESSLKISPFEQVKLLSSLYTNAFHFKEENIQTIKDAILLSKSDTASLYGKTGTGAVGGKNTNGWFVGYVEQKDNTYFFAVNIQAKERCSGSAAAKIALSILENKALYTENSH